MSVQPVRLVQRIYVSRPDGKKSPGELEMSDPFALDRKADSDGVIRWPASPGIYKIEAAGLSGEPCIGTLLLTERIEELRVDDPRIVWEVAAKWYGKAPKDPR